MGKLSTREVYIVDGARTPFLKAKIQRGPFSASDLAVQVGRVLLKRHSIDPTCIDQVILGCVMPAPEEANIARIVALRLGCGAEVPAWTVQRNCASGMQAIDSAAASIASGRCDLVLSGGTEAMSRAPWLISNSLIDWFSQFRIAQGFQSKLKQCLKLRANYFVPTFSLLTGLHDHTVNLSMGQTAENIAYHFNISRQVSDEFSMNSHQRAAASRQHLIQTQEVIPVFSQDGTYFDADNGIREDTSLAKLAKLKPIFDKPFGQVTAGNSSQVSDGAALLLLASTVAIKKYKLPILARIVDTEWAGVDPAEMGLGPVHAVFKILQKQCLTLHDINYWEINEAFAVQVLGCLQAFNQPEYCKTFLKHDMALGNINIAQLNIHGGAIALGHPVGATGARCVLHLAHVLKQQHAKTGVATLCIGGGQGGAMLIEVNTSVRKS